MHVLLRGVAQESDMIAFGRMGFRNRTAEVGQSRNIEVLAGASPTSGDWPAHWRRGLVMPWRPYA